MGIHIQIVYYFLSSLARAAIRHLREKDLIKIVGESHHSQYIYTTNVVKKEKKDVP